MKVVVFSFLEMIQSGVKIADQLTHWCNFTGGNFFCKIMSFCGILPPLPCLPFALDVLNSNISFHSLYMISKVKTTLNKVS